MPVPDALFADPRLARVYDAMEGERADLEVYAEMVDEFGARSVLDVGCGTGTFACLLAGRGVEVIGLDPAEASLDEARRKPWADRVRWVHGDLSAVPPLQVDLVTMTANVAQVFVDEQEWDAALRACRAALRPGGRLVLETRDPARQAWREWNREASYARRPVAGIGDVETWVETLHVTDRLVSFRWTFVFAVDGTVLTSDSTLRFRTADEVTAALTTAGFQLDDIRDSSDRPGRELVFVARRPG